MRQADVDQPVRLSGWLRNRRDHGGVLFVDLADHYGVTQLVIGPGTNAHKVVAGLPKETVLRVDGVVVARDIVTIRVMSQPADQGCRDRQNRGSGVVERDINGSPNIASVA